MMHERLMIYVLVQERWRHTTYYTISRCFSTTSLVTIASKQRKDYNPTGHFDKEPLRVLTEAVVFFTDKIFLHAVHVFFYFGLSCFSHLGTTSFFSFWSFTARSRVLALFCARSFFCASGIFFRAIFAIEYKYCPFLAIEYDCSVHFRVRKPLMTDMYILTTTRILWCICNSQDAIKAPPTNNPKVYASNTQIHASDTEAHMSKT